MGMPLISLAGVRREFPAGEQTIAVLKDIDLSIEAGEMVAIVGASGSGKSTLMNILGCLDRPTRGEYRVDGRSTGDLDPDELAELRREHFGFIFQRYHLLSDLTAQGNVEVPAVYAGKRREARLARADALLERLGLAPGARSLWDRPELAGVWTTLLDGGWLELSGGAVRAASGPVPAAGPEDGEGFVEFGHALITAALLGREARTVEDGGFRGMPDTIAALLVACGESGLRLPPGPERSPGARDGAALAGLLRVLHDLGDLADCGVLTHEDGVFRGGPAVMLALVGLLRRD
jgi:hypothetical protein